jgi:PKD repeat protein
MKKTTHQKTGSGLFRFLMILALLAFSLNATAQCTAGYTYTVDPSNNGDVAFTNTSSSGTGLFYSWDYGDGYNSPLANPGIHYYSASGTYMACLTIYDSLGMYDSTLGCYSTYCDTIAVINTGGPATGGCSASFFASDSATSVYFYNTSSGTGLSSTWTFGDGTSGTSTGDIAHNYPAPGTYIICLTISDFLGTCSDTYCDSVTIGPGPSGACLGIVDPTYTAVDSSGTVYFSNTVSGSGPVYFWDFGDGSNSSVVGSTTHTYASNGTYWVCLTVYESTGTDSCQYCNYVTVGPPAGGGCSAYFAVVQDTTNLYNYFVYNYASTLPGVTTYMWDFGDGTTSTAAFPTHTYTATSPVSLCLTITNSYGGISCTSTYCDSITPGMMMSGPFTVNVMSPTGIEEQNVISTLENYPNPFSDNTSISYSISKDAAVSVSVVDLLGNTVALIESGNHPAGSYTLNWNAEGTAEGMYLLQLKVNNTVSTKKLVISR